MTDPTQPPVNPQTPPSAPPVAPAYQQAAYPSAPAYNGAPSPTGAVPGRTLGIVAFVVAIFFNVIGLILGIVALVQSRRAGAKNGWAVAAIIVGAILFVLTIVIIVVVVSLVAGTAGDLIQFCTNNPDGIYELNGQTITCSSR